MTRCFRNITLETRWKINLSLKRMELSDHFREISGQQ